MLLPALLLQIATMGVAYYGQEPLEVEPWFAEVYAEIEECADLEGDYSRLVFMQADSLVRTIRVMELFEIRRLWGHLSMDVDIPNDTITIKRPDDTVPFREVLKHEMGHHVFTTGGKPYGHHRSNEWARCSDPEWKTGS